MKLQYAALSLGGLSGITGQIVPKPASILSDASATQPQAHKDIISKPKASERLPLMKGKDYSIQDAKFESIDFAIQDGDKGSCQDFLDNSNYCLFAFKCFFVKSRTWANNQCSNSCAYMKENFATGECDSKHLQSYIEDGTEYLCTFRYNKGCVKVNTSWRTDWIPATKSNKYKDVELFREYELSFDVKYKSGPFGAWTNLIHIGNSNGYRFPGVWFPPNSHNLHIVTTGSGAQTGFSELTSGWSPGNEYSFRMRVTKDHAKYGDAGIMEVWLDGQYKGSTASYIKDATVGSDLGIPGEGDTHSLYIGDPWFNAASVELKDVRYIELVTDSTYVADGSA